MLGGSELGAAVFVLLLVGSVAVHAQSAAPAIEVATITFSLDEGRVRGAPEGADSARFDIVAKAPTDTPAAGQTQLMLRTLLADRFGLVAHPEKRNRSAYALIVDGGGLKVTLTWRPDTPGASDDGTRPSLFTAIREQLGLRLDARTLPVDVIVVDRLSLTPTPN